MIEYKKILNYIMMFKSWVDSIKSDEIYRLDDYLISMESNYLTDEEWEWIRLPENQKLIHDKNFRELIDNIYKIMGIYKEPVYIVE